MEGFCAAPQNTLTGADELRAALLDPGFVCDVRTRVKSTFICDTIREIRASGFPYNITVYSKVWRLLDLPAEQFDGCGGNGGGKDDRLRWLVYWNQDFTRNDDLESTGYYPLTQAMLDEAHRSGRKVNVNGMVYNVRLINGLVYAMKPRVRKYAVRIEGQPAKIVEA